MVHVEMSSKKLIQFVIIPSHLKSTSCSYLLRLVFAVSAFCLAVLVTSVTLKKVNSELQVHVGNKEEEMKCSIRDSMTTRKIPKCKQGKP